MMRLLSIPTLIFALIAITCLFSSVEGLGPVDLGLADSYAILAGSAITSAGTVGTIVNGNIGTSPGAAISGFPPGVLNGASDAANGASGGAQGALTTAYNFIATRPFNTTLSNQDLGGMILLPGVYKFDVDANMNGMLTLDANGSANAVWMFQIGAAFLVSETSSIIFKDSIGNPDYVYWQVGSSATIAAGVPMVGNMLALTAITIGNKASVQGRCLARNAAVTLDVSVITKPPKVPTSVPTAVPSFVPSLTPSAKPSATPSVTPTMVPSASPTVTKSAGPTFVDQPTMLPSAIPTATPSAIPTANPSAVPSTLPSAIPSANPTLVPSANPSAIPSVIPSAAPSILPTVTPSVTPSMTPSASPSAAPSLVPSVTPSVAPSVATTAVPSISPSFAATANPTTAPSVAPSAQPSAVPSARPTVTVTSRPTFGELPIDLGLAEPYAILAGSAVTSTGVVGTVVTGDIGVFPGTAVSGFPPGILNGAIDSANGASGGAQGALTTAYDAVAARQFNKTLSNQDLGGMTLFPGVYRFDGAATMNGMLTLDARGDAAAVWMFQIGSSFLIAGGSSVIFKDSIGNPDMVYWQVGSSATLAAGVSVVGNFMALASITVNNGATVNGRCLARNGAVTLDKSVITKPAVVAFSATQTVSGISLEQFNANITTNTAILKESVAKTMPGVLPSNIKNFEVSAGPSTAAATLFLRRTAARALAGSSIQLKYDVVVSSTKTSEQLQTQLKNAVSDGSFDNYMHAAATEQGATNLQSASSDAIETETITPPDHNPDSSDSKDSLSDGAIAGIVIGVVIGTAFIVFALFWLCGGVGSAPASGKTGEPAETQRTYAEVAAATPESEMTSLPANTVNTVNTMDNDVAVAV